MTLDYIYGLEPLGALDPDLVCALYAWEFQTPSCRSVRARKALLAEHIDLAGSRTPPRILSLACGHVREARDATLLLDRGAGAFFAVDQDAASLAVVRSELSAYGVEAIHGSVRGVLARKLTFTNLDLAYAAGLYDYLADTLAGIRARFTALSHDYIRTTRNRDPREAHDAASCDGAMAVCAANIASKRAVPRAIDVAHATGADTREISCHGLS